MVQVKQNGGKEATCNGGGHIMEWQHILQPFNLTKQVVHTHQQNQS